jgi:hypothetical protein
MKPLAILFMILILLIVWGGFIVLAVVAVRRERSEVEQE